MSQKESLGCTPARWRKLVNASSKEGTKYSTFEKQPLTPRSLVGTYAGYWESYTAFECGSDSDEPMYLDLSMESPSEAARKDKLNRRRGDAGQIDDPDYWSDEDAEGEPDYDLEVERKDVEVKKEVNQEDIKQEEVNQEEVNQESLEVTNKGALGGNIKLEDKKDGIKLEDTTDDVKVEEGVQEDFSNIYGRFRWWRMIAHFKGLYRPEGAPENIWYFGNVTWTPIKDDSPDSDEDDNMYPDDNMDCPLSMRDTDDFALAALVTVDDNGALFVEMLCNITKHEQHRRTGKKGAATEASNPEEFDYVRILWKKTKNWSRRAVYYISNKERRKLQAIDKAVTSLEPAGDSSDDEEDIDIKAGVKREADSMDEEEKRVKRIKVEI